MKSINLCVYRKLLFSNGIAIMSLVCAAQIVRISMIPVKFFIYLISPLIEIHQFVKIKPAEPFSSRKIGVNLSKMKKNQRCIWSS